MREKESLEKIEKMSPEERWQLAAKKLSDTDNGGIVDTLLGHMRAHENTRWLVYNAELTDQIPRSYAAHAFTELQKSALNYEVIRLCSFWDKVDFDSRSIPTIVALADCSGVSDHVYNKHYSQYQDHDPELARRWGIKGRRLLRAGIQAAKQVAQSDTLLNVRNYRDRLAHQLEITYCEKRSAVPLPRYGDERKLLEKTVKIVGFLYRSISGTGFDWTSSKAMHVRNAEAFWKGVKIEVLR